MIKRKRGFTLGEIMVVVIILGILAAVSLPMYNKIIKRTGFKEVASIVSLVRAGAKYYDLKYDLTTLDPNDTTAWGVLKVDKPSGSGANLTYKITSSGSGDPALQVSYGGSMLYEYDLITGSGTTTADPNAAYLPADLPS